MNPEERLRSIEIYLTNLDDHLLARGVDPRVRLDHVEQVADTVLSAGSMPEDEFGPAEAYAVELADALEGNRRRPSLRFAAAAVGWFLALVALSGLLSFERRLRWDLLDLPYEFAATDLVAPLMMTLAAAAVLSPTFLRLIGSRFTGLRGTGLVMAIVAYVAGAVLLMVGAEAVGAYTIELVWTWALVAGFSAALVVGLVLVWWSGLFQLIWGSLVSNTRAGSSMSYNPFGTPKVKLSHRGPSLRRVQPVPPPSSSEA